MWYWNNNRPLSTSHQRSSVVHSAQSDPYRWDPLRCSSRGPQAGRWQRVRWVETATTRAEHYVPQLGLQLFSRLLRFSFQAAQKKHIWWDITLHGSRSRCCRESFIHDMLLQGKVLSATCMQFLLSQHVQTICWVVGTTGWTVAQHYANDFWLEHEFTPGPALFEILRHVFLFFFLS